MVNQNYNNHSDVKLAVCYYWQRITQNTNHVQIAKVKVVSTVLYLTLRLRATLEGLKRI